MHRLIIGSLSFLLMSVAITPAVRAEMPRANSFDSTVENSPSAQCPVYNVNIECLQK